MAIAGYNERWAKRVETYTNTRTDIKTEYIGPWSGRAAFVTAVLGIVHPDNSNLKCDSVELSILGDCDGDAGGPETCVASLSYVPLNDVDKDKAGEGWVESWSFSEEAITIGEGVRWSDGAAGSSLKNSDLTAILLVPTVVVTYNGTLATFPSGLTSLVGKVNSDSVSRSISTFSAGKLLFKGANVNSATNADGDIVYKVSYVFQYKPMGWDQFWRKDKSGGAGWDTLVKSNGDPIYDTAAFTGIPG